MPTTLPDVLAAMRAAMESMGWTPRAPPGSVPDQESSWEVGHFAFALDGPSKATTDYATAGQEMREQVVLARCFADLSGDPTEQEPALMGQLEGLGAAVERWQAYPPGTDLVAAQECAVERDLSNPSWGTGVIRFRVRYAVPYLTE